MGKIKEIFKAVQAKQIGVLVTIMMCFLALVMFSWLVGFWANGHAPRGACELKYGNK